MAERPRYPGITYDTNGYPLTASDWKAHDHLASRGGFFCSCNLCQWAKKWAEKQTRIRGAPK